MTEADIEKQKEYNKILAKLNQSASIKECFHHNKSECVLPIINAHSLQRQGPLKNIESDINGSFFVYSHTDRQHNEKGNFFDLKPIGRKGASTFSGFCSFHDTKLFEKIENDFESFDVNNEEHLFLYTYRAFAHSYHIKHEDLRLFESDDMETKDYLFKLHGKNKLLSIERDIKMTIDDMKLPKSKLDFYIENAKFDELNYLVFEFPFRIPIACAGVATPPYTFKGKEINTSGDPNYFCSSIITTVLPFKDRSIIILAAFPDEPHGIEYLDEIDNIKYDNVQEKYLSFHLINNMENIYLSPNFYNSKSNNWKRKYCELLDSIGDQFKPYIKFDNKFPINYFSELESIKN